MTEAIVHLITPGETSRRLGRALAQAFRNAPDCAYVLGGHKAPDEALTWFFGNFLTRLAFRYGNIHATADGNAAIFAIAPGNTPSLHTLISAGLFSFPARFGWKATWRALALSFFMERRRAQLAPSPHWYLMAVGVAPTKQGRGIGYNLMTQAIRRAEIDGLPCYVEVFDETLISQYQRRGFEIVDDTLLANGLRLWSLVRPPSTVAAPSTHSFIYF